MLSLASKWLRGPGRKLKVVREGRWVIGITVGVGLAAINTGNNLLFLVWGMLLSAVMLSGVLSEAALRGLNHRRVRLSDSSVGSPASVQIEMSNDNKFWNSYAVQVGTLWQHDSGDEMLTWGPFWVEVSPKSRRTADFNVTFPKRGRWTLSEMHTRTSYPFAFFEKTRFRKVDALFVWVAPELREVEVELDMLRDRGLVVEHQQAGHWGDIRGIRPFRLGDPLGLVHWLSTARHQSWMSKELEEARGVSVSLRWSPMDLDRLEKELSDLHSVLITLLAHGVSIWLEIEDTLTLELRGDRGSQQLGLALAQYGFEQFSSFSQERRPAICLGSAKPRLRGESLYQVGEIFREVAAR